MSLAALLCLSLCIVSARAQAQTVPAPTGGPGLRATSSRGVVSGLGGLTFGTETGGLFGGMFGINVTRNFQIVGKGARMLNIMPKSIQEPYDALSELISTASDDDVRLNAKMPMTYAQVGTRSSFRRTHGFAPNGTGGFRPGGRCDQRFASRSTARMSRMLS